MKLLSVTLLLLMLSGNTFSQADYKVIKVNGSITLKSKGISLETGTIFSEQEELLFNTDGATAAVINSVKGRMILTGKKNDLSASGTNYLPAMYNISTRGLSSLSTVNDLRNHFSGQYVVLDRQAVVISHASFKMDLNSFFYIQYTYNGETINKKPAFSGDSLIIDKTSLFSIDGTPFPAPAETQVILFYKNGEEIVFAGSFNLIFPEQALLKKEIKVILDEIKSKTGREKINEINSYITEFYGKTDRRNLEIWLNRNFELKSE
jgi:hypothetical protein